MSMLVNNWSRNILHDMSKVCHLIFRLVGVQGVECVYVVCRGKGKRERQLKGCLAAGEKNVEGIMTNVVVCNR